MATFYLIRHGSNDLIGRALAGRQPVVLNDEGKRQAEKLSQHLGSVPFTRLLSSPLERTQETIAPLAEKLGLKVENAAELIEIDFGKWTNAALTKLEGDDTWKRFNEFRSNTRVPGGELMIEAQARVVQLMNRLSVETSNGTIALVSHGDVIRSAVTYYLGMPLDFFPRLNISPASYSIIELSERAVEVIAVNRLAD